jgi:hypothetical protein
MKKSDTSLSAAMRESDEELAAWCRHLRRIDITNPTTGERVVGYHVPLPDGEWDVDPETDHDRAMEAKYADLFAEYKRRIMERNKK